MDVISTHDSMLFLPQQSLFTQFALSITKEIELLTLVLKLLS